MLAQGCSTFLCDDTQCVYSIYICIYILLYGPTSQTVFGVTSEPVADCRQLVHPQEKHTHLKNHRVLFPLYLPHVVKTGREENQITRKKVKHISTQRNAGNQQVTLV